MQLSPSRPHLIRLRDLADQDLTDIVDLSQRLKRGAPRNELAGKAVGMLFFRGSLRTRTSLEIAMHQLGGYTVNLSAASDFWELESRTGTVMDGAAPEHIKDAAASLSRYVDALAVRPSPGGRSWEIDRADEGIRAWAEHASVPVINMESVLWHPLQGLADLLTMRESLGELKGKRLAITWTSTPSPKSPTAVHTVIHAALRSGMDVRIAHPEGYELDDAVVEEAKMQASERGRSLEIGNDIRATVEGTHMVYAGSWPSLEVYGNATLAASRGARVRDWCVDEELMSLGDNAKLMHPMPVRRNLEVTDEVLDGPRSLIYNQAENRLHTQKGLLTHMLRS
ncbi:MAG: N-acetylornithine carbamoyltransferase [Planctomycetota bacterium]|jgi:N-acetylornithine carbamoyltransferase